MKTAFFYTSKGHIKFDSIGQRDRYKQCERKVAYSNYAANIIVKKIFLKEKVLLNTYLCPTCKMWHLTHKKDSS